MMDKRLHAIKEVNLDDSILSNSMPLRCDRGISWSSLFTVSRPSRASKERR